MFLTWLICLLLRRYFVEILAEVGPDVETIELLPDGGWRAIGRSATKSSASNQSQCLSTASKGLENSEDLVVIDSDEEEGSEHQSDWETASLVYLDEYPERQSWKHGDSSEIGGKQKPKDQCSNANTSSNKADENTDALNF